MSSEQGIVKYKFKVSHKVFGGYEFLTVLIAYGSPIDVAQSFSPGIDACGSHLRGKSESEGEFLHIYLVQETVGSVHFPSVRVGEGSYSRANNASTPPERSFHSVGING